MTFTLEGHTFKASQVDRKFSYGRLTQRIEQNRFRQAMIERVRNYTDEQRPQVTSILQSWRRKATAVGAAASKSVDCRQALDQGADRDAPRWRADLCAGNAIGGICGDGRPAADGVDLSGRSARLGGVREIHDATHGPGPNRGGVCRAGAGKWWGGTTARPYLWKEKASDTTYRESWDDPREPRPSQNQKQQDRPRRFITPKKKSRGPSRITNLSDTRVHQLELKAYLYKAITRRTYEREIRELPLLSTAKNACQKIGPPSPQYKLRKLTEEDIPDLQILFRETVLHVMRGIIPAKRWRTGLRAGTVQSI